MKLLEIRPKENFRLFVRYDDGTSGDVDLSAYVGRGVFKAWEESGLFEKVRLTEAGHPEWPGGLDLCPDSLYLQLTGKQPFQTRRPSHCHDSLYLQLTGKQPEDRTNHEKPFERQKHSHLVKFNLWSKTATVER